MTLKNPNRRPKQLHRLNKCALNAIILFCAALLFSTATAAAPGDILFSDDFERASLGPTWSVDTSGGGDAGISNATANSPTRSMYTRWNVVTVTSTVIDLSIPGAELQVWVRRGDDAFSEDPDAPGEDLLIQYFASDGSWVTLERFLAGTPPGEIFTRTYILPVTALHAGFRIRVSQTGGNGSSGNGGLGWDYWHVDDIILTETTASPPPPSVCPGALFEDGFESGVLSPNWSATGAGDAGVGTQTAANGIFSMYTRWGSVSVTSTLIDLSAETAAQLSIWVRRGADSFSEDPDTNENLVLEYLDFNGNWQPLETFIGNGTPGEIFNRSYALPASALHAGFRLQLRQTGGSGVDWDYWHIDDVCVQPVLPPTPFAYYTMDETSWNGTPGEVIDSSVNSNNGTAIGNATTASVLPAIPGDPGTCGYGEIPFNTNANTQDAVDTGVDVNDIGNAGTISFWYKGNRRWRQPNRDRQLLDASTDNIGNANDKYFFLVMRDRGRLRFALEDSNDGDFQVQTARFNFARDEWVYITVTWDLAVNELQIYINGSLAQSSAITSNGNLGNLNTLFAGDNRGSYLVSGATGRSADGSIDELRIYSQAVGLAQIQADMNSTHPCGALHHLLIQHDGAALTCQPENITVTACATADCSTQVTTDVTVTLTPTGWVGGDTQTISGGTAVFQLRDTTPGVTTLGISSSNPAASNPYECLDTSTATASCDITFYDTGFVYTIPTQTSCATSTAITVAAVRKDDTTQQCVPSFSNRTENISFWTSYVNPATGTNQVTLNNGSSDYLLNTTTPGSVVPLAFDVNGEAQITVTYPDAGQLSLNSEFNGSGAEAGLLMTGSASWVTKPDHFYVYSDDLNSDCASADTGCSVFRQAGQAFNLKVRAACADNSVTPNFEHNGIDLSHSLIAPAGGIPGTIGASSTSIVAADNGESVVNNQTVSEVGVFAFTAQLASGSNYLGETSIGTAASNTSVYIGRFVPAWFDVTRIHGCAAGAFTYSGQPFSVTATARNTAGNVTQNYDGALAFARTTTLSDAGDTSNFSNNTLADTTFASGVGNRTDVNYTFPNPETVPSTITLRAEDLDNVSSLGHVEETTEIHSGRVKIDNAFGSELEDLAVPTRVEHYLPGGFAPFANDVCTDLSLTLTKVDGTLNVGNGATAGDTCIWDDDGESGASNCSAGPLLPGPASRQYVEAAALNNGDFNVWLKAPGQNFTGNVDVTAIVPVWLRYDWSGGGPVDPVGRATFGIYRGDDRIIYWREQFE